MDEVTFLDEARRFLDPHATARVSGTRIAAGTDEIMRDVIGERVLGLATEPTP